MLSQYMASARYWPASMASPGRLRCSSSISSRLSSSNSWRCLATAAEETLELLEWSKLSNVVSSYAATSLGKQRLQVLELPSTKKASEVLLGETYSALEFEALRSGSCDLGAIETEVVRNGLDRVGRGAALSGAEAAALAVLLDAAASLQHSSSSCFQENKDKQDVLRPIYEILSNIDVDPETAKAIWRIVDEDGSVRDSASPELRKARMDQLSIEKKLEELMKRIVSEKAGDDPNGQAVSLDGRFCVAVSTENSSKVPGLLLRSFSGGSISFIEPSAAVALNNSLAQAKSEASQAEYRVLYNLTTQIQPFVESFKLTLDIVADFDAILARGRFSSSLGATRPEFIERSSATEKQQVEGKEFLVRLEGARHPLLLGKHKESLREAKARLNSHKKNAAKLKSKPYLSAGEITAAEDAVIEAEKEVAKLESLAPVPIDILIKRKTKVVTITGPNTGGKTAAIKTLGLAVLMARAGLYVLAKEPALLPWVDQVLADIGDQQSLSQSLSTFSGHLHRIKQIQREASGASLVLLDEVGTGTDFLEGAALGMAVLESFAESVLLTLATTHHGELKMLKYRDERFENASVEFDEEKLTPTYRLLWGIPGRSNALDIAAMLGLPAEIIEEARRLHGASNAQLNEVIMSLEKARMSFARDFSEGQRLLEETKARRAALELAAKEVQEYGESMAVDTADQMAVVEATARSALSRCFNERFKR